MSETTGQVARRGAWRAASGLGRLLHRLAQMALALVILVAVGAGTLAVRLAQGPVEVAWLARRITTMVNGDSAGTTVTVGRAALTWEGLHGGLDRPIDLVLGDVTVTDAQGRRLAQVPRAAVSLVASELFLGRVAFRTIDIDGLQLKMLRAKDGSVSLDLGTLVPPSDAAAASDTMPLVPLISTWALAKDHGGQLAIWSHLQRLRIRNSTLSVDDRQLGVPWSLPAITVDLTRPRPGGAASGTAAVTVAIRDQSLHLDTRLALLPNSAELSAAFTLDKINPAHLATLAPVLAPLAAVDAPVSLSGTVALDDRLALRTASLKAEFEAGNLHIGEGVMPIRALSLSADATPDKLNLRVNRLLLQPRDNAPKTTLTATVAATRANGAIDAKVVVDLDQAAFADLSVLWPAGTGGPGTRPWLTQNVTAGMAHGGHVELEVTAPEDFSDAKLVSITGGIDGSDVSTHWLRPVLPIEHGEAHVVFVDPDTMDIFVTAGRQGGTQLTLKPSKIRLTGLAGHDQFIAIVSDIEGPFSDVVALLSHPKIHLLDRLPIAIKSPAGQVTGHLTVNFPLKTDLDIDQVAIHATGKLAQGHAGGVAVGRDLDRAALDYDVNNSGLKITGNGDVGGIASRLDIGMDFRPGPPSQVTEYVNASSQPDSRQLIPFGLNATGVLSGPIGLQLGYFSRRDTTGEVNLKADLSHTTIEGGRVPFTKSAGSTGSADARFLLKAGKIVGIDRVRAEAPGLSVLANADTTGGGKPNFVRIQRLIVGDTTNVTGDLRLPEADGQPYVINLTGPSLDASSEFDRHSASTSSTTTHGPAFRVDLKLGRVVMAGGRNLTNLTAHVENDGDLTRNARISATSGTGPVVLSITPERGGRRLAVEAQDAGAMLRAVDVIQTMSGGRLVVQGTYDDTDPTHPLRGTAELTDFRIRNAPAIGRLLQAMSLYGLVELVQGPGLGFNRMVAPFQFSRNILTLGDSRAYNASLGITVKGQIDLHRSLLNLDGTVIPAYFFNSLLGRVPLLGRLFSPESGGGVFAATYSVTGTLDDPSVSVNPLAALTPGFLRGFFDIFGATPSSPQTAPRSDDQERGH